MDPRKFNLKKRKADRRDYSHAKSVKLGADPLQDELLFLTPILDQGSAAHCTAYSAVSIRQSETSRVYDPEGQWQEELEMGATEEGTDLQTQLATGVDKGFTFQNSSSRGDNASAYFWITKNNGLDIFDSMRRAIQDMKRPLTAGIMWKNEWDNMSGGIIKDTGQTNLGGHAVKIAGWKQINGIPYLVIQNSWGVSMGDNGLFYFPREVANVVFGSYGIGYWSDDPTQKIKKLGFLNALLVNLYNLYVKLWYQTRAYPPPLIWSDPVSARHSVRVICDSEGLDWNTKNVLTACVEVESNFNPQAVHPNKDKDGNVWSTDWGICQVNDYWNIGEGKPFPSTDYVLQNPEACIRWMCQMFKAGKMGLWASYSSGIYKKYL